jgi:DNA replication protein DnaC
MVPPTFRLVLREELAAKQRKRVAMGIAHLPAVKTLDDFDFKFQPSVDQKLVRELPSLPTCVRHRPPGRLV